MEEITEFNDFLSASGRYLIVSKKTSKRVVTELKKMARKETYCVESVPQTHTQNHCHAVWETVPNPKFDPTFSCNDMAAFDSCIDKNKEKFVRSYRVYKGNKCASYSYTINMCKAFETRQWTSIHPITEDRSYTDLIVYRFEKDN